MAFFWKSPHADVSLNDIPQQSVLAKRYFPYVDGFRALAIILILARHARDGFQLKEIFKQDSPTLLENYFLSLREKFVPKVQLA